MKRHVYLFTFLSFGCNNMQNESTIGLEENGHETIKIEKNESHPIDTLMFTTQCDTIPLSFIKTMEEQKSLLSFQKQTYIYCSPRLGSQVLDSIPFNTNIVSQKSVYLTIKSEKADNDEERPARKRGTSWYETKINGQTGYFLSEARWSQKIIGSDVLFGIGFKLDSFQIISYDSENNQKAIDSVNLYDNHGYTIKTLDCNGLDFSSGVIRYFDYRSNCPGTSSTTFIVLKEKGELIKLFSAHHGTEFDTEIYFPMKFESGKTLLVADGNLDEIFNYYSGELNTFPYPKGLNVPINQLIIKIKKEYAEDIEGLSPEEIEFARVDTSFYKWNGNELLKITTN